MTTLHWIGKEKVVKHHQEVPFKTLRSEYIFPSQNEVCANSLDSKIIHGDNLEAIKALLPKYEGRVKCIYIDPPYNTGKEGWEYNDNVNDPRILKWLGQVVGKEGEDLSRHDKWLCMMFPRLKLLHRLLSENGVMFISIGDDEQAHLKKVCDQIFGPRNFLAQLIWFSEGNTDNQLEIKIKHEYVMVYLKNIDNKAKAIGYVVDPNTREDSNLHKGIADNNITKNNKTNPPHTIELPVGFPCDFESGSLSRHNVDDDFLKEAINEAHVTDSLKKRYSLKRLPVRLSEFKVENYKLSAPYTIFSGLANKNKLDKFLRNDMNPIVDDSGESLKFYLNRNGCIRYTRVRENARNILSVLTNMGTTERMRTELKKMGVTFDYPKPVELIEYLVKIGCSDRDGVVLDSFAGSGTTAHAVLSLNKKDNGSRKFILCEMMDYADTKTATRVKKVISGYGKGKDAIVGLGGSFEYLTIGDSLFDDNGNLNPLVPTEEIRRYVAYTEGIDYQQSNISPFLLGTANNTAYFFYYESDRATALDFEFLASLRFIDDGRPEMLVVYADNCLLAADQLKQYRIIFKKIPRDVTRF